MEKEYTQMDRPASDRGEQPTPREEKITENPHANHRQRVREEFLEHGLDHFTQHKMLEFLLYYSVPRIDTNPMGHKLIDQFGSLSGVIDADYQMLRQAGLNENSAVLIKLAGALAREYLDDYSTQYNVIKDAATAKEYMRHKFLSLGSECLLLACMGHNGKVLYCGKLAEGTPETVSISPAEVVRTALRNNASSVLLAHNHPNGFCNPSGRDVVASNILWEALKGVEIGLMDHIIVGSDGVCSMVETGNFPKGAGW